MPSSNTGPRVPPLPREQWTEEVQEILESTMPGSGSQPANIFTTLAHHPKLLKRWSRFGGYLLFRGRLPARDRELLILRTGWNCRSAYEWGQHVVIGRGVGLSDEDIDRVPLGPDTGGWDPFDAALLRAADELHLGHEISDATWAVLTARYDTQQMIEVCFTVGQYHLVAMTLNTLRVERDEGVPDLPTPPR